MIEGCLPENNVALFSDKLKEGLVYQIESFMVMPARRNYRTVSHANRIKIGQRTKITEIEPQPDGFPLYAHNIKTFDILAERMKDTEVLSGIQKHFLPSFI